MSDIRPEWTAVRENLRRWYEWAQKVQPDTAKITHLGGGTIDYSAGHQTTHCGGGLFLDISPTGWHGSPVGESARGGFGVLVFQLHDPIDYSDRRGEDADDPPPFTQEECDALMDAARDAGWEVSTDWNGVGYRSFSVGVRGMHPSVQRAAQRYLNTALSDRCRVHKGGTCKCIKANYDSTIRAELVSVVVAPPAPGPVPVQGSNLRAIRGAMITIAPMLDELGITPRVMSAGKRGEIIDAVAATDGLAFMLGEGHGVLLPAEVAVRLVELAFRAFAEEMVEAP